MSNKKIEKRTVFKKINLQLILNGRLVKPFVALVQKLSIKSYNVFKVEKNSINYSLMLRCGKMSAKLFINSDDFMPEKISPFSKTKKKQPKVV